MHGRIILVVDCRNFFLNLESNQQEMLESKCLNCFSFRSIYVPQEPTIEIMKIFSAVVLEVTDLLVLSSINPDIANTLRKDYNRIFGPI